MRAIKLAVLGLFCLVFCACAPIQLNVADLMQTPKLTAEQSEIYNALTRATGVSDVRLKYPKSGQHRSSFVLFDLDGDKEEEALVFYTFSDWNENVRMMILDRDENGWNSVYDAAGEGTDIAQVDFCVLTSSGEYNLLVGWEKGSADNTTLSIYRYGAGELNLLYESEYTDMLMEDFDLDGTDELILAIKKTSSATGNIRFINETAEGLQMVSRIVLENNVQSFLKMQIGRLSEKELALFVDVENGRDQYYTEIFVLNNIGKLRSLYNYGESATPIFWRNIALPVGDYDGDGIMDLPAIMLQEGEEITAADENSGAHITFLQFVDGGELEIFKETDIAQFVFLPSFTGYVDLNYGFLLKYPDPWVGMVSVKKEPARSEWIFSLAHSEAPSELLRIRVYEQSEIKDVFDSAVYEKIAKRGLYEYYLAIPAGQEVPSEYVVTVEKAKESFSLIK